MFFLFRILLLVGFIRLLLATENPLLCSVLYGILTFLLGLAWGGPILAVLIVAGVRFVMAGLYFWLLNRIDSGSGIWWLIAVGGILIGLV